MRRFLPLLSLLVLFIPFLISIPAHATTYDNMPYGVTLNSKDTLSQTAASTQDIKNTGLAWVREAELWKKIETSQGVYDWSLADTQVNLTLQYGLKVDWVLMQAPDWYIQPGCTQVPQAQPLADFAVKVFQRYGSKISSFEVGNEEWSFEGTASCKTPQNYLSVLNVVAPALRNAGYAGLVGMFGYTNYSSAQQITDWFTGFIGDVSNPSQYIDYYNFHFYHGSTDPNVAYTGKPAFMDVVNAIHNVALQFGHGQKPSWVTEYGYNTNCNQVPGCPLVTPDQQAQFEQEILDDGRTSGGMLDHAFVYTLMPGTDQKSIYQNGQPLPAATMEAAYSAQYPSW